MSIAGIHESNKSSVDLIRKCLTRCLRGVALSQDDNLLNLTSAHLNIGLRGIPVGTCRTSFVTPGEGVHYCGYPISELADFLPEDIVYLLFNKELPSEEQSEEFVKELQSRGNVPDEINTILATLPRDGQRIPCTAHRARHPRSLLLAQGDRRKRG